MAGREERRRFWAAIAAGTASEDAAVGRRCPAGGRNTMVQEGRGHAAIDVWAIGEAALWLDSLLRSGRNIVLLPVPGLLHAGGRSPARAGGIDNLPRAAAQRRHPSGGLEYRATTAQWHAERAARRPKQAKLARNAALRTYVEERLAGVVVAPSGICSSRPGRVLEKPSARTTEGPAMERLEPGANRPSPAGGLPGRRDHAHQP